MRGGPSGPRGAREHRAIERTDPRMSAITSGDVRRSLAWVSSGTAFQVVSQVTAIAILARLLSPYEFGVVSAASLVTQLSMVFSEFGVGPCVVQVPQLSSRFLGAAFRLSCALGSLMAVALWCGAPQLAKFLNVGELAVVLRVYAIVFVIKGWSATQEALLQRDLSFRYLARADGWSFAIGYASTSVVCALLGLSYWAIVAGHVAQAAMKAAFVALKHPEVTRNPGGAKETRDLVYFGLGQTLSRLASFIGSQTDGFFVTRRFGVDGIGLYGRANQLITMPTTQVGNIFDTVIFPVFARAQSSPADIAAAYRLSVSGVWALSCPLAVLAWLYAPEVVHVALGSGWELVVAPMQALAIALPFRLMHKISDPMARAMGATYLRAWRQWVFAALVAIFVFTLGSFGLPGVAYGVVCAAFFDALLMLSLCRRLVGMSVVTLLESFRLGTTLGVVTAVVSIPILWLLRLYRSPEFLTILIGAGVSMSLVVLIASKCSRLVLGRDGHLLLQLVRGGSADGAQE